MLVRMKVSMSGPNVLRQAGAECEVSDAEAVSLFGAGFAEPVRSAGVERATAPPAERAVGAEAKPKPRKRARRK